MVMFDGFKLIGLFILLGLLVIDIIFAIIFKIGEKLKKWQDKYYERNSK